MTSSIKLESLRYPAYCARMSYLKEQQRTKACRCTPLNWLNDVCDVFCCLCPFWSVGRSLGKFNSSYFCFEMTMVSKKIHIHTDNSLLFRNQSRGTWERNQISGLTVVAHWPVENPNEPIITQRKKLQRGKLQSESSSPQSSCSTLGQQSSH